MHRLLFVLGLFSSLAFSQFAYQTVDISGATSTQVRGINSTNEIVGFYRTTSLFSCTDYDLKVPNCAQHGFKIVNGVVTKLDVPNSVSTVITGVNDSGDLVGYYQKSDSTYHGFLWLHTNTIQTLDFPNSGFSTVPMGVNKSLTIVGGVWGISSTGTFAEGGLIWKNGTFRQVNLGTQGCTNCTSVNGVSNNGNMVGQTFRNDFWNGFFKKGTDKDYWTFQSLDTFTTGVNNNSDVVGIGAAQISWFAKHIELNEGTNDATEVMPGFIEVIDPLATDGTFAFGLNAARTVVGTYGDSNGMHGFIATPTF